MHTLSRQLLWLIVLRMVVVSSVLVLHVLLQIVPDQGSPVAETLGEPDPSVDPRLFYLVAGATFLASLVYLALLKLLEHRPRLHAYIQFFGDLLLVTVLVYFFGGVASPFTVLYLLVIVVATTMLKRRTTAVATLAFALYTGLMVALFRGWLPIPEGSPVLADETLVLRLAYNLAIHFVAFYAVAFLTWLLVSSAARAEEELVAKAEDLADLEVKYRDVVQSITSGLATTDRHGVVTSVNRAGERILRRDADALIGRPIVATGMIAAEEWEELSREHDPVGRLASEIQPADGEAPIHVGYSVAELRDAEGRRQGSIVIFQDLTPWKKLEEEVRIKDRMAAVGNLAAGLAHEIGNPLAAISGSVQMLSASFDDGSPERRLLDILHKESERLDRTIKNFLRFARSGRPVRSQFDVVSLLGENFALLENSSDVDPGHRLVLDLEPESFEMVADPDAISQIFWNLTKNALRAMPDGGTLTVSGRPRRDPDATGDGPGALLYELAVHDTGEGMSEEARANLFHPFQSFFDGGTGLGMAIVYRLVQDHGGSVSVDSRLGSHTRIAVALPAHSTVPATRDPEGETSRSGDRPAAASPGDSPPASPSAPEATP